MSSEVDSGDSQPASGTAESGMTSSEESEETSLEEDMEVAVPSDSGKVWKGGTPLLNGIGAIHVPDECPQGHVARSRYQTFVQEDDTEKFRKKWRKKRDNNKFRPVLLRNEEAMH